MYQPSDIPIYVPGGSGGLTIMLLKALYAHDVYRAALDKCIDAGMKQGALDLVLGIEALETQILQTVKSHTDTLRRKVVAMPDLVKVTRNDYERGLFVGDIVPKGTVGP